MYIHIIDKLSYSSVPNKCVWWNKHIGGKIPENLVNVLDGITVMVGIFGNSNKQVGLKVKGRYGTNKPFFKKSNISSGKMMKLKKWKTLQIFLKNILFTILGGNVNRSD